MRNKWWHQTAAGRQLKTMLKKILEAAWERRIRESIRSGEGEGGEEESGSGDDG